MACASVIIAGGCADSKPPPADSAATKPGGLPTAPKVTPSDLMFDAKGDLVESDEIVAGLRLPRGVRLIHKTERRHMYETHVEKQKVQKYFGRRLFTGAVEQKGQRVVYKAAVPKGVKGGIVKLDVAIYPMSGGRHRIEIKELRPMPKQPLSDQQVQSLLKEQQKYMQ